MNQFRTITLACFWGLLLAPFSYGQISEPNEPSYSYGDFLYTDIDTVNQKIYTLLSDGLWEFDIAKETWSFLMDAKEFPSSIINFDFAFDNSNGRILLWNRGVGLVYEVDLIQRSVDRIDDSFDHKNQFGHHPFFRNGKLHAFGGYGFWEYKNFISYFNNELSEWKLISVSPKSEFAPSLDPAYGFYKSNTEDLFIYGGYHIENNQPDYHSAKNSFTHGLWRFSFTNSSWSKLGTLLEDGVKPYSSSEDQQFGVSNTVSRSFYSPVTENWYIPVQRENKANQIYYLTPFNSNTITEYSPIEIPLGTSKSFLIASYLFNPKTQSAYFIGIDNKTNTTTSILKIKAIPESILIERIDTTSISLFSKLLTYILFFGVLISIGFIVIRFSKKDPADSNEPLSAAEFLKSNKLDEIEVKLVELLYKQDKALDTQSLEELVWSDIDNYDYRRKLRNETINAINNKFSKFTNNSELLIQRQKDPNDNRRYLYEIGKMT